MLSVFSAEFYKPSPIIVKLVSVIMTNYHARALATSKSYGIHETFKFINSMICSN